MFSATTGCTVSYSICTVKYVAQVHKEVYKIRCMYTPRKTAMSKFKFLDRDKQYQTIDIQGKKIFLLT